MVNKLIILLFFLSGCAQIQKDSDEYCFNDTNQTCREIYE